MSKNEQEGKLDEEEEEESGDEGDMGKYMIESEVNGDWFFFGVLKLYISRFLLFDFEYKDTLEILTLSSYMRVNYHAQKVSDL